MEFCVDVLGRPKGLRKFRLTKFQYYQMTSAFDYTNRIGQIAKKPEVIEARGTLRKNRNWYDMNQESHQEWVQAQDVVWNEYATVEHARLEFEKKRRLQRSIDRYIYRNFTQSYDGKFIDPKDVIVYCGDASFPATGPHEKYGASPHQSILKVIQRLFQVILIDEHWTTMKCSICNNCTDQLYDKHDKPIRDYRRCKTCNCNIDRDYNACMNIANASIGWRIRDGKRVEGRIGYLCNPRVYHCISKLL
jgi:hypothetical protein